LPGVKDVKMIFDLCKIPKHIKGFFTRRRFNKM